MNKTELVNKISERLGTQKTLTEKMVNEFLNIVTNEVKKGNVVRLRGFGTFYKATLKKAKIKSPNGKEIIRGGYSKIKFRSKIKF